MDLIHKIDKNLEEIDGILKCIRNLEPENFEDKPQFCYGLTREQIRTRKENRKKDLDNACLSLERLTKQMQQETERLKLSIKEL